MAAQGERVPGVVDMCSVFEPMAQDTPVQDIPIPEQDESLSRTNPKPGMGAAAAAAYDASPPPLRQNPPILAESAQPSALDMILQAINGMKNETNGIKEEMKDEIKKMRGEMRQMGHGLQAGMKAIIAVARDETRNMGRCLQAGKMATPRAGSSELKGSAPAGEDRVIRSRQAAGPGITNSCRTV